MVTVNADMLISDGYAYFDDNPDGDVSMVIFPECPRSYCRRTRDENTALVPTDGNMRLDVKQFPSLGRLSTIQTHQPLSAANCFCTATSHRKPCWRLSPTNTRKSTNHWN